MTKQELPTVCYVIISSPYNFTHDSQMSDMDYSRVNDKSEWHRKRVRKSKSKVRADESKTHSGGEIMVVAL